MSGTNLSYLYTAGSYAAIIGVGYLIYSVSTRRGNRRAAANSSRTAGNTHNEPRKEDKKKKQRLASFASEAQEAAKAKASAVIPVEEAVPQSKPAPNTSLDDEVDNREFARQLAKVKEGKKFANRSEGAKQKEKSVKQSRANQIDSGLPKEKPSETAAEADDDQSAISSPETLHADVAGVSDMLEPTPAGPSVMRITDGDKVKEKKPKAAKAPEKTETKKQRQNKKKAEAAKEAREDAEKERKALEEKQRRTARIAEGRAAKDGSQFMATNGVNSWSKGAPNGTKETPAHEAGSLHQPLDTLEHSNTPAAANIDQPAADESKSTWMSSLPSEEEQMEMLKENDDEWSTVPSKSSKRGKKGTESGDEAPKQAAVQDKQALAAPQKAVRPAPAQNYGSFSALNTDDADEEKEEEWDV